MFLIVYLLFSQRSDPIVVPEAPPSFSHSGSSRPAERIPLNGGASVDSGESKTCRAIKDQTRVSDRAPSSPPAVCFSSHLSELDSQLAALQNIADRLEMDFSHSRMVSGDVCWELLKIFRYPFINLSTTS